MPNEEKTMTRTKRRPNLLARITAVTMIAVTGLCIYYGTNLTTTDKTDVGQEALIRMVKDELTLSEIAIKFKQQPCFDTRTLAGKSKLCNEHVITDNGEKLACDDESIVLLWCVGEVDGRPRVIGVIQRPGERLQFVRAIMYDIL
jgi:hypothetical protein